MIKFIPRLFVVIMLYLSVSVCDGAVQQNDEDFISIVLLSNEKYAHRVMKLIRNARQNIRLCMSKCDYKPGTDDIAAKLLEEIAIQSKRGIEVEVVLERGIGDSLGKLNPEAKTFLYESGVKVYDDSDENVLNGNMLIVDNFTCVAGTTVWTSESINRTNELEFWIESEEVAQMLIDRFNDIKERGHR